MLLVQGVKHKVVVPKEMTVSLSCVTEGVGEEYRVSKRGRGWKFRGRKSRFKKSGDGEEYQVVN